MIFDCADVMQEYGKPRNARKGVSVCYRGHTTGERSSVGDGTDLQEKEKLLQSSNSGLV